MTGYEIDTVVGLAAAGLIKVCAAGKSGRGSRKEGKGSDICLMIIMGGVVLGNGWPPVKVS